METVECDGCGYPCPPGDMEMGYRRHDNLPAVNLCQLCFGTQVGALAHHPGTQLTNAEVAQVVCYVGNAIIERLKGRRE